MKKTSIAITTALLVLSFNSAKAATVDLTCEFTSDSKKMLFNIQEIDDENSEQENKDLKVTANFSTEVKNLLGAYQVYAKNNLSLELISSEAMRELGLNEWDLDQVKFYYASTHKDDLEMDLVITSIKKANQEGVLKFAGAYGSYKGQQFLCTRPN